MARTIVLCLGVDQGWELADSAVSLCQRISSELARSGDGSVYRRGNRSDRAHISRPWLDDALRRASDVDSDVSYSIQLSRVR